MTGLVHAPALPASLVVMAIAQMGGRLVFFLHITTRPDNTNNVLALALGVLIEEGLAKRAAANIRRLFALH
jgi:cytochrome o ubiquinol oxidase operon protein cyoD